ncbi:glycogen synthase GlgA [Nesterenkonia sp. HG001]|uniref:glycogen synthase GlgA n=1 Tax=Nesterenkonia sp. HG001 TaxID=2983207 RepID=UPI002AC39837|nr:glycogen synthase GlgA [Nesterenkonia sp. HG001]MDZ5076481.1 glycogen synthase GlgA [Nesterenkonia sp. HG001]
MPRLRGRVLSVASECAPLMKTGGLADVVGALPGALESHGWRSRVLMPAYPTVLERVVRSRRIWRSDDLFGGPACVRACTVDGFEVLLLDAPHLFDRPGGPYSVDHHDHPDNHLRFAALSWAAAQIAIEGTSDRWRPDIVHAHDWQAGLVPAYLRYAGSAVPSVMTIHNIAFQGVFDADQLDRLNLPTGDFHPGGIEYHGAVSALKAGMVHASRLTTVSRTYAEELTTPQFGFGLEGVVAERRDRGEMHGIVNGIDATVWDPARDPHTTPFSAASPGPKAENRASLLKEFGLAEPSGPLAVVVTRLTHQKGVDMLLEALPAFVEGGGAVVVLGSGDPGHEQSLREVAAHRPDAVGVRIGYDEPLSHRMFAGGDLVLVPSRFEPCGLTQLYGLRYGALPLVASTGGLRDTVVDATDEHRASGTATGFTFTDISTTGLRDALDRAASLYQDQEAWREVRDRAMTTPVDWAASGAHYAQLFQELVR